MMDYTTLLELSATMGATIGGWEFVKYMLNYRANKRKENSEAKNAESEATKSVQDVYQEMVQDLKDAWREQKEYIGELNTDRRNLRSERDDLRNQIIQLESETKELREEQRNQADKIAHLGRVVKALTPLVCSLSGCQRRERDIIGLVADDSFDAAISNDDDEVEENTEKNPKKNKK